MHTRAHKQTSLSSRQQIRPPGVVRAAVSIGFTGAAVSLICCIAPAALLLVGIGSASALLAFESFFRVDDGGANGWGWGLRAAGVIVACAGVVFHVRARKRWGIGARWYRAAGWVLFVLTLGIGAMWWVVLERGSDWVLMRIGEPRRCEERFTAFMDGARAAMEREEWDTARVLLDEARVELDLGDAIIDYEKHGNWEHAWQTVNHRWVVRAVLEVAPSAESAESAESVEAGEAGESPAERREE